MSAEPLGTAGNGAVRPGPAAGPARVVYIPGSHLDLYWLGSYLTCLDRGDTIIKAYLDRCLQHPEETFAIETVVFAEHFLTTHPDYLPDLRRLIEQGRVDIGAAYIDRWENLVLGESLIRNVQIGRRWLDDHLGFQARTALHPDVPGLNPQTPQIYRQAGVPFYATARKIFPEGRVFRAVGPDGSALLVLRWCGHYNFVPLSLSDLPPDAPRWGDWEVSFDDVAGRFPLGTLPISATAGDLTESADFQRVYGAPLAEFLGTYRRRHPDIEFGYSTPTAVLAPYADSDVPLAEIPAGIPSVWGVAADESSDFFHRSRAAESLLLAAETAAVIARRRHGAALPESSRTWRGAFDEDAFFARKDPIAAGHEFEGLWRMHLFTQDHNGGGQEGRLSSFQKRVRQDRVIAYSREVIDHALTNSAAAVSSPAAAATAAPTAGATAAASSPTAAAETGPPVVVAFNPRLAAADGPLLVDAHSPVGELLLRWAAEDGPARLAVQPLTDALGGTLLAVGPLTVPPVGTRVIRADDLAVPDAAPAAPRTSVDDRRVRIDTADVIVEVDRGSGRITCLRDAARGLDLAGAVGRLTAVPEIGNDVTMRTDETARVAAETVDVELLGSGPMAAQIRIVQRLLDVEWIQVLTVWNGTVRNGSARVDLEVGTRWPGTPGWQVRIGLAPALDTALVTYGSPFHATGWADVPAGAQPRVRDEIDVADYPAYREIQQWMHVAESRGGLTVTSPNPGVHRHSDGTMEAVLLRTSISCGDERFAWDNAGPHVWRFGLHFGDADVQGAGSAHLGDIQWRPPILTVTADPPEPTSLLVNSGDPVLLSALYPDGEHDVLRLVNISPRQADVFLRGPLLAGEVQRVDLTGAPNGETWSAGEAEIRLTVPPWRIQTFRVRTGDPVQTDRLGNGG
jgi:alpha-mannosidase